MASTKFLTDTATLCVFDVAALRHRLHDTGDWWSIVDEELKEINAGNAAFIGLGSDGDYEVDIGEAGDEGGSIVHLKFPSGRVFVGCGEEVTAGGLEPECIRGGTFLDFTPGAYVLSVRRTGDKSLEINLRRYEGEVRNSLTESIRV
jgi:hypothetical protein